MKKPVLVLSNNDGCVVAMSQEAKALGIPRGIPIFKLKEYINRYDIAIFSSNYALYFDLSSRVMNILQSFSEDVEIYSIDEAFLLLKGRVGESFTQDIRRTIKTWTGLPVSIGIGPSKTLAKAANKRAKNEVLGTFDFSHNNRDEFLSKLEVGDIWGIGRQNKALLNKRGINTAQDLVAQSDDWVKKNLTMVGLRTKWELEGKPSIDMEKVVPPKKGILSSKSFSHGVTELADLREASADYCTTAAEKLRKQRSLCRYVNVSLCTNNFKKSERQYFNSATIELAISSSYTPDIVNAAQKGLEKIFRKGFKYKKVTIYLTGIEQEKSGQLDLFIEEDPRKKNIMQSVDKINNRYGRNTVNCMSKSKLSSWQMKREKLSPLYTSSWKDLLVVQS